MIGLNDFDRRLSKGRASAGKSLLDRLIDFLLGPANAPHPIYTVGVAAGFGDSVAQANRPRKAKPERAIEDADSEAIYCGLAGAGLPSYGFVAARQEYENGRR
jgi:hypothetical protein